MRFSTETKRNFFQRLFGHLATVHAHRREVRKNCFACGLYWQGLTHDLSKYSPAEWNDSVRYYQGFRSPYAYQKELLGYAPGWLHHKGHNKHHWEYWYDTIHGKWQPIEMPYRYVIEMVCDRVAASKTYMKENYKPSSALQYFQEKQESQYMHPNTYALLDTILHSIAENGEEATFQEIRANLKKMTR